MLKQLIATAAALMVSTGVAQARQSDEIAMLKVGDPAPKLTNVTWVQGEPVSDYQSGQVYVLDFWATWCGPCKASIPHMNDLHKKHQKDGVNVIGLAIWPRPNMVPTAEFVKEKGDDMGYRIAEDVDGKSAEMFMKATGQNGIPTVMVVDKAGKLAWIGYPMGPDAEEMDATINRLIANTFDLSAATSKYEVKLKKEKKVNDARRQLTKALNAKNFDEALFMMDSMLAEHPEDLAMLAVLKYQILLVEKNDPASAGNWGRQAIAGVIANDAELLNRLAWFIADPENPKLKNSDRDADLALMAAQRASDLGEGKNPGTLDTLAHAYFLKGDTAQAIKTEQQAIAILDEKKDKESQEMKKELQEALTKFEKAGNKG